MKFALKSITVGGAFCLFLQGTLLSLSDLPYFVGMTVGFASTFAYSLLLYKTFMYIMWKEELQKSPSEETTDKVHRYLFLNVPLPQKLSMQLVLITSLALFVVLGIIYLCYQFQGTVWFYGLNVLLSSSIFLSSYWYFASRRWVLSTLMELSNQLEQ